MHASADTAVMPTLRVAFLGDIFAAPGRRIVEQQLPRLRTLFTPDLIIANAENVAHGSGLTPEQYRQLRGMGIDGITLGDHAFRDARIREVLQDPKEPILRPANLSPRATGKTSIRLVPPGEHRRGLAVITVLGRIFMSLPADDPFRTVDEFLATLPPGMSVIVEAHMEATSEKAALAHYLDGRVAAVLGTHTHVPTADARILPGGTALITDLGMCGAFDSCIGRDKISVLKAMTTGMHNPFGIGQGDERLCGALVTISDDTGLALSIERIELRPERAG